ncbi:unnamed protein product [Amoebophrya sp. A120]|nr:unnamed protein product [Amoebophrya sp. A120]|eukprot:GSA120T00017223001.1
MVETKPKEKSAISCSRLPSSLSSANRSAAGGDSLSPSVKKSVSPTISSSSTLAAAAEGSCVAVVEEKVTGRAQAQQDQDARLEGVAWSAPIAQSGTSTSTVDALLPPEVRGTVEELQHNYRESSYTVEDETTHDDCFIVKFEHAAPELDVEGALDDGATRPLLAKVKEAERQDEQRPFGKVDMNSGVDLDPTASTPLLETGCSQHAEEDSFHGGPLQTKCPHQVEHKNHSIKKAADAEHKNHNPEESSSTSNLPVLLSGKEKDDVDLHGVLNSTATTSKLHHLVDHPIMLDNFTVVPTQSCEKHGISCKGGNRVHEDGTTVVNAAKSAENKSSLQQVTQVQIGVTNEVDENVRHKSITRCMGDVKDRSGRLAPDDVVLEISNPAAVVQTTGQEHLQRRSDQEDKPQAHGVHNEEPLEQLHDTQSDPLVVPPELPVSVKLRNKMGTTTRKQHTSTSRDSTSTRIEDLYEKDSIREKRKKQAANRNCLTCLVIKFFSVVACGLIVAIGVVGLLQAEADNARRAVKAMEARFLQQSLQDSRNFASAGIIFNTVPTPAKKSALLNKNIGRQATSFLLQNDQLQQQQNFGKANKDGKGVNPAFEPELEPGTPGGLGGGQAEKLLAPQ